ncbi:uncharacterized protein [Linepithema humile]|uniref:uncharacterized protein n=1 Tax=Linepithema humile TaxID=83485 RepID=UPI00351DB885
MKYLCLTLDGLWKFTQHFDALAPRVNRMANALCRLLPNLGGPGATVRHLYTNTVRALVRKADRRMAIRIARCYRTVSYVASTTLAGVLPFDLVAASRAESSIGARLRSDGVAFPRKTSPGKWKRRKRGPGGGRSGSGNTDWANTILRVFQD